MGNSAEAILFWGFPLGEDESEDGGEGDLLDEWEDKIAEAAGHPEPTEPYGEATKPAYRAYWDARHAAVKAAGVMIDRFGCGSDYSQLLIGVTSTFKTADWSKCAPVSPLLLNAGDEGKLRKACEALGIPWQEPKWYLTAYYG
jgi:hypothetical protein